MQGADERDLPKLRAWPRHSGGTVLMSRELYVVQADQVSAGSYGESGVTYALDQASKRQQLTPLK